MNKLVRNLMIYKHWNINILRRLITLLVGNLKWWTILCRAILDSIRFTQQLIFHKYINILNADPCQAYAMSSNHECNTFDNCQGFYKISTWKHVLVRRVQFSDLDVIPCRYKIPIRVFTLIPYWHINKEQLVKGRPDKLENLRSPFLITSLGRSN